MEFLELVQKRYSVRAYKPDPIDEKKLEQVLEAARLAPTAANKQPFQFLVIRTAGKEAELRRLYDRAWFAQAPVVICACGIPAQAWVRMDGKNYCDVDVAIAMDHLVLAAWRLLPWAWARAGSPISTRQ
ncbi:MAG: nitroreductase [Dehalococcoidia bacterium]|nr:nitroreductase [Dehalococcoidia bacterium]